MTPSDLKPAAATRAERRSPPAIATDPEVTAILEARHADAFAFLGMHKTAAGLTVRTMWPGAQRLAIIDSAAAAVAAEAERVHSDGLFIADLPGRREPFRYHLLVSADGVSREYDDIYRFSQIGRAHV